MTQRPPGHDQLTRFTADDLTRLWVRRIGLTVAVGIAYFLAARLSLYLQTKPDGVAVFWPAVGVTAGVMIAHGRAARLPAAFGTMVAGIVANLMDDRTIWSATAFSLCNAGEALLAAWLIEHYFGTAFSLGTLRQILGLLAATIVGSVVSGVGATAAYKLLYSPAASALITWQHWFSSNALGIITVAPVVIGFTSAVRGLPPRSELIEGIAALVALTVMTGIIISLPQEAWETVMPVAWLFPFLLWLAARCQPIFAAAGAFIVSLTVVCTTIFGIGHFGSTGLPTDERILQSQVVMLVVALFSLILAGLFAERRANEANLAHSNMMLERERDNKLMNLQAVTASMAHEVKQPLAAIVANSTAALRFLGHVPPNLKEARSALNGIVSDSHRTNQIFENIRALFARANKEQVRINVNQLALEVLRILRAELSDHTVTTRVEMAPNLPFVMGHRGQLQEVFTNLYQNSIEAMDSISDRRRMLQVRTKQHGDDAIAVEVEDTGPGILPKDLGNIFDAFVTTKLHGIGLGLAICRLIIESHGGQLSASSDGNKGALFKIILPIE